MRFGYAFMGVRLVIIKWPLLIQDAASLPVMDGVVTCLLTAMSLLALLGLRYPVRTLPILLFDVAWKLLSMEWSPAGLPQEDDHDPFRGGSRPEISTA
jgi:hypothetical protein